MKVRFAMPAALALCIAVPLFAQHPEERHTEDHHEAREPIKVIFRSRLLSAMFMPNLK